VLGDPRGHREAEVHPRSREEEAGARGFEAAPEVVEEMAALFTGAAVHDVSTHGEPFRRDATQSSNYRALPRRSRGAAGYRAGRSGPDVLGDDQVERPDQAQQETDGQEQRLEAERQIHQPADETPEGQAPQ